jgi:hypothetical protein
VYAINYDRLSTLFLRNNIMGYAYLSTNTGVVFSTGNTAAAALADFIDQTGQEPNEGDMRLVRTTRALAEAFEGESCDVPPYYLVNDNLLDEVEPEGDSIESAHGREMSDGNTWRVNWTGGSYEVWQLMHRQSPSGSDANYWAFKDHISSGDELSERELRRIVERRFD